MAPQKTKEMCPVGRITFMVQTETGSEEDNSQRAGLAGRERKKQRQSE